MRKPRYLEIDAEYHVTAKINRGEFTLESKEIKEMFLQTVKTNPNPPSYNPKILRILMMTGVRILTSYPAK